MKLETNGEYVRLVPETKDELEAVHNIQCRGIKYTILDGALPDGAQLMLHLGEDYIAKHNAVELPAEVEADQILIRFSLSRSQGGAIEVFSCDTNTQLVLPLRDVDLLIEALTSFHRIGSLPETVCLDPSL